MQIIFLPKGVTILLCFLLWPALQLAAAEVCHHLSDRALSPDNFFFKSRGFEREGRLYERWFRVTRWKHLLPDAGAHRGGASFQKKKLQSFSTDNLHRFLIESARAELTHWLAIPPVCLFGLFIPANAMGAMLVYALLVNLPCIVTQRYNRPRVRRLLRRMQSAGRRGEPPPQINP